MGQLGEQPVRKDFSRYDLRDLSATVGEFANIAEERGVSIEAVIEIRRLAIEEARLRQENLAGDYHDEHLAGFADRIDRALHLVERFLDHIEQGD